MVPHGVSPVVPTSVVVVLWSVVAPQTATRHSSRSDQLKSRAMSTYVELC
jgi:hypothetical protein